MMTRLFPLLAALLFTLTAGGQVRLELVLDQEQFLPGETLAASVRITNLSGQPLELGGQPDWLSFFVERKENNFIVEKSADAPVEGIFKIDSSLTATKRVNISPYFNLAQAGRYTLTANVKIPQWQKEISAKRTFDIVKGAKIWEQEFGVPQTESPDPPVMRRFVLLQANFMNNLKLYVRVSDLTDNQVLHVFPLGPMVSFSRPEAQVDKLSQLHVLHQSSARSFNYSVVDPSGRELVKETYQMAQNRPVLKGDGEGKVFVSGGTRMGARPGGGP